MSTVESTVSYRPVTGFPGYRVGDDGSVWSLWLREPLRGKGGSGTRTVLGTTWKRMVCNKPATSGHMRVCIRGRAYPIHRLVLTAFVGPCPAGMECCHGDGNPANNALTNLRWDVRKANIADRFRHDGFPQGERHYLAKLTTEKVRQIRADFAVGGLSYERLAVRHGINSTTARDVVLRKTWKHVA